MNFIKENYGKPILLLLTKRRKTGLMFLSLSEKFGDKVKFAEMLSTDKLA